MRKEQNLPWTVAGQTLAGYWHVLDSEGNIIAITTNKNNAQLFASAPELLEALIEVENHARCIMEIVRSAIAQAMNKGIRVYLSLTLRKTKP